MKTYDCKPTLTDQQVIEFCKYGYLMFEEVVPDEINKRVMAFCDTHPEGNPNDFLKEAWFVDQVLCNAPTAGAVRSLLGRDYGMPLTISNHRVNCPREIDGGWHCDDGSQRAPNVDYLQVFYYPQATPLEMGPTELLPGSHHLSMSSHFMKHLDSIVDAHKTAAPAGSIFITVYSIWHRATTATAAGIRNLIKYTYWRTAAPTRDWVVDPNFRLENADFATGSPEPRRDWSRVCHDAARMYLWLRGELNNYEWIGGLAWPASATAAHARGYCPGLPADLT